MGPGKNLRNYNKSCFHEFGKKLNNKKKKFCLLKSDPKGSIPKKILEYAAKNQALCAAGVRKKVEKK